MRVEAEAAMEGEGAAMEEEGPVMVVAMVAEAMEVLTLALILDTLTMLALTAMDIVGGAEAQVSLSLEALTTTLWAVSKHHIIRAR